MTGLTSFSVVAALATSIVFGLAVRLIVPPPKSLASRVRPYLAPTVARASEPGRGAFAQIFGPILSQAADALSRILERPGREMTLLRLRQAGMFEGIPDEEVVGAYRMSQLRFVASGTVGGLAGATIIGLPLSSKIALGLLGLVVGGTRQRGRIEKAIDDRREIMRIEIYTVNQLLAMRVRAGGGVVSAVQATVARGSGAVISELAQAMRLQRAGWRAPDAFRRIAEATPEPFCSRTYRLLASAEERGSDLASALLALSEDVRESRREAIKRSATKRRAAMLVPTIAVLAPVLILFVAAPLPFLITGWQ